MSPGQQQLESVRHVFGVIESAGIGLLWVVLVVVGLWVWMFASNRRDP